MLSKSPKWQQSVFAGYIPAPQSIKVPASQDHIHFLKSAVLRVSLPKPSKIQ
jgi:hypothetical protein